MSKFSNWLREAMNEAGMNQHTLAKRLGVSDTAVSKWQNNKNLPDAKMLLKLADIFDIDPAWLLNLAGYPLPLPESELNSEELARYKAVLWSVLEKLPEEERQEILAIARLKAKKHK